MAKIHRNLYDFQDFFRLIIDGNTFYIEEPIGWEDITIKCESDKDYFGFNFEFLDAEVSLVFPSRQGLELIQNVYDLHGSDGRITFEYGYSFPGTIKVLFAGSVNLNTIFRTEDGIRCNIEKTFFQNNIRTRSEAKVNMSSSLDFNGNPITPLEPIRIKLHSKHITKYGQATETDLIFPVNFFNSGNRAYIQADSNNIQQDEVKEIFQMPLAVTNGNPVDQSRYHFKATEAGFTTLRFNADYHVVIDNSMFSVRNWKVAQSIEVYRNGTRILNYTDPTQEMAGFTPSSILDVKQKFSLEVNFNILVGDEVYFIAHIEIEVNSARVLTFYRWTAGIGVVSNTVAAPSYVLGYKPIDILNRIIYSLTGVNNVVTSEFYGAGGEAEKFIITNGYQIRNFDIENRPVSISYKEILDILNTLFLIGVQYSYKNNHSIRVENIQRFFGTKRILDLGKVFDYEEQHATDITYNEVEIGYTKYPENENNTLDEHNTIHKWLLPITSYKKLYSVKTDCISSGYIIEQARREQFKISPSTSLNTDDNLFIIAYTDSTIYKDVSYTFAGMFLTLGRQIELRAGDKIKLIRNGGGGANDATVFEVENRDYGAAVKFKLKTAATDESGIGSVEIVTDVPVAERDEAFMQIENVISPHTAVNLRLSPKHLLFNHSPILTPCLEKKGTGERIVNTFFKNNGELTTRFHTSEPSKLLAGDKVLKENGVLTVGEFRTTDALFRPITCTFKARIYYDDLMSLTESLRGEKDVPADNFGVISFIDINGHTWTAVVIRFEYNPTLEECKFTVRKKVRIA